MLRFTVVSCKHIRDAGVSENDIQGRLRSAIIIQAVQSEALYHKVRESLIIHVPRRPEFAIDPPLGPDEEPRWWRRWRGARQPPKSTPERCWNLFSQLSSEYSFPPPDRGRS